MPPRRPLTRRDLDVRLGYTGLGVGAVAFVLVLVASFVVIEVAPRIDLPDVRARQSVVRYPALESVPGERADRPVATAERTGSDRPAQNTTTVAPGPEESGGSAGDDGGWSGNSGEITSGDPGAAAVDGPLSQALGPTVDGLTGAVDAATGGVSSPVTGPAGGLTDEVIALGDALLDHP